MNFPQLPQKPITTIAHWLFSASKYLVIFFVIYCVVNWWRQPVMPVNTDLTLTDHQGKVIDIHSISNQSPTLIYFWGSWCSVCSATSPKVNTLAQSGYPVVTIAIKSGDNAQLNTYLTDHGFTFQTVNDTQGTIFRAWQGKVTPSYVIIKNGKVTQGFSGVQPVWSMKFRLWLSSLS